MACAADEGGVEVRVRVASGRGRQRRVIRRGEESLHRIGQVSDEAWTGLFASDQSSEAGLTRTARRRRWCAEARIRRQQSGLWRAIIAEAVSPALVHARFPLPPALRTYSTPNSAIKCIIPRALRQYTLARKL